MYTKDQIDNITTAIENIGEITDHITVNLDVDTHNMFANCLQEIADNLDKGGVDDVYGFTINSNLGNIGYQLSRIADALENNKS